MSNSRSRKLMITERFSCGGLRSSAVRLKCCRGELFISIAVVDVMTGVIDGLGGK